MKIFKKNMYITYCRNQKSLNVVDTTQYRRDAIAGEYRPTYLIRVSDWEKVPGKQVETGYCALSYAWEQSGDVVQKENGEYDCIDNGRHCIVEGYDMNKGDLTTMTLTEEEKYEVQFLPSTRSKATIKHVTYEELLQQICKDFEIQYLCNTCYTVAIIPEVHIYDPKHFDDVNPMRDFKVASTRTLIDMGQKSLWWKRSWTLEEKMSSKRILVIGADAHLWQHSFHTCNIPTLYYYFSEWMLDYANQKQGGGSVNQALSQAHFWNEINIKTTFHHFYRTIATHDLSILCFGSNLFFNGEEYPANTMKNHDLPSWTGVSGLHLYKRVTTTTTWLRPQHSICDDMLLHISTKYYKTISVVQYDCGRFSPLSHDIDQWDQQIDNFEKREAVKGPSPRVEEDNALIDWAIQMTRVSGFYATHYYQPQDAPVTQARPLSLTEDCDKCIILPTLLKSYSLLAKRTEEFPPLRLFDGYAHDYFLPVIKKYVDTANGTKGRYKAIGIYYLGGMLNKDLISDNPDEILISVFGDNVHSEAKEFIIQ
ncbi:hypothetical protein BDA99DRAFT_593627 [Phascolomyces articulosus]|uniref:Heterokaryon incompatibility domain-containing protein n=1 Tax=Phascolomyces articulosus TaxID=60185 RepID=A0AAD5JM87_9FUNG|nr:hypothetical protein BDA99DRAFT_593627 [Phascolomyces articulosus]